MSRGAFITLEGAEGVGKSSCLAVVRRTLASLGHEPLVTREPGGTPIGEQIRDWILHGKHGPLTAELEALLMFAARAVHVSDILEPALAAGRWVVCDRFSDATFAYQGGGRGADDAYLRSLAAAAHGALRPDLTLLLDAPVEVGLGRIRGRALDHFEREGPKFLERVRRAYLELARADPGRVKVVDASRPLEDVEQEIGTLVQAFARKRAVA